MLHVVAGFHVAVKNESTERKNATGDKKNKAQRLLGVQKVK